MYEVVARRSSGEGALKEVGSVVRSDRVYAVAIDEAGKHLLVGGRDKKVALYGITAIAEAGVSPKELEAKKTEAKLSAAADEDGTSLRWEHRAEDFVYAVAMSSDLKYCVLGGTDKRVTILAGASGMPVKQICITGIVWALALLDHPKGARRAVGDFTSCFLPLASYFLLLASYFLLLTSYFLLLTSNFLLLTSYFLLLTSQARDSP